MRLGSISLAALVVVYLVTVLTGPGQWLDDEYFGLAQRLGVGPLDRTLPALARSVIPPLMAGAAVLSALLALVRGRWRQVLRVVVAVGVAVGLSRLLRDHLWRPDLGYSYPYNTFPSTHVTAVAVLALAVWLLVGLSSRTLAVALVGLTALAVVGNVVGYAHRPSDVVASLLLVGAVAGLTGLNPSAQDRDATDSHTAA